MKIDFKKIPHTTDLFKDYLYDFEKVSEFYSLAPYDEKAYRDLFSVLENREYDREMTAEVLMEQNRFYNNAEPAIESISRIKDKDTFVIITGQQVGLFGGPLYTLYKAMTAINLARYLTLTTPHTFLPFFWIEGEDHDFEEIRRAYIIDGKNNPLELCYEPKEEFKGTCVGKMVIDETMEGLIDSYADSIFDTDFKEETLKVLRDCYKPGRTLSEAFGRFLAYFLGPYGLILVNPSDPRFKRAALPVFETSLMEHKTQINPKLKDVNERLAEKGYHNQVGHRMDTLDFFYHNPRRLPFIREGEDFRLKDTDKSFTREELLEFMRENVEDFSPNVILRPQVQDYLFPTAAYVAGPSEVAYFAQYKGVYEVFGTPMPIIYPRKSLTLVEGKIQKIIDKYNVKNEEIFNDRHKLEKRILLELAPEDLQKALNKSRGAIMKNISELEKTAADFNKNLQPVIKTLRGRIGKELSHAETKIKKAVEKKNGIVENHLDKLYDAIFPDYHLQERHYSILSFFHKYYHRLIYNLMELTCCRHENNHIIWEVEV